MGVPERKSREHKITEKKRTKEILPELENMNFQVERNQHKRKKLDQKNGIMKFQNTGHKREEI